LPETTNDTTIYVKQAEVGGAKSGAIPNASISLDPDLAQIVAAWFASGDSSGYGGACCGWGKRVRV
jgi:hypothetical protein